ncbi:MAG: U32 family peptidase [Clostridiaceae bacterium]|nr:U32 family peptidase [Clostridiaceae bacterium]
MGLPEILAPVGGQEQLLAAVRCGADAVYLGAKGFNARRSAENFDEYSLSDAVSYCHARGVHVHVTVNTLVMDDEMEALEETARQIAESGADAVIIQDLAVMRLFRDRYPTIRRHASTQMAVHNTDGVLLMQELGFDRVVLARELSLREIERINSHAEIETETFVHGAHCMSVSGACYLSAMLGGRSGNRGMCAQPCRLNFRFGTQEYALSLKDLSFITHIRELSDAGVVSLKIEGRMKRPEYVAAAVTACREALAGNRPDLERLRAVFSRSGFTDGYLTGRRSPEMFGHRRREDVQAAENVLGELAGLYKAERQTLPVDLSLVLTSTESRLDAVCGEDRVSVTGPAPQAARTRPTDADSARKSLEKMGGTPFYLRRFEAQIADGIMLPVSGFNALRRAALEELLAMRGQIHPHPCRPALPENQVPHACPQQPALWGRFETAAQLPPDTGLFDRILLPAEVLAQEPALTEQFGDRLIAELPALLFPEKEPAFGQLLSRLAALGVQDVLTDNAYGIRLAKRLGFRVHGGFGLNILNTRALSEYERLGLSDAVLSFELSMQKIRTLGGALPRGILAYGQLPLMRLRACPAKSGCASCSGHPTLTDRRGVDFPLLCHRKEYTTLLNSVPLYIGDKPVSGVDYLVCYFTRESTAACECIASLFAAHAAPDFPRTNGLYYRSLQ